MPHQIRITQAELKEICELDRELAAKQKHLEDLKETVTLMLKEGFPIEDGRFDARLDYRYMRPVPWKQVLIEEVGESRVDEIYRTYKGHSYPTLRVEEHAVPPLWRGHEDAGAQEQS